MVGRWLGHIPKGNWTHENIADTVEIKFEHWVGWTFHYFIGAFYALLYFVWAHLTQSQPTVISTWFFGLITILSPWLIMQPGLGLGIAAHRAKKPGLVRTQNFILHSLFGLALYFGWTITSKF